MGPDERGRHDGSYIPEVVYSTSTNPATTTSRTTRRSPRRSARRTSAPAATLLAAARARLLLAASAARSLARRTSRTRTAMVTTPTRPRARSRRTRGPRTAPTSARRARHDVAREEALRVRCYAVNARARSHHTVSPSARWLRRYAAPRPQAEGGSSRRARRTGLAFAEGFAAFKIPSKTIVAEVGIDRKTYLALASSGLAPAGSAAPGSADRRHLPARVLGELWARSICAATPSCIAPFEAGRGARTSRRCCRSMIGVVPESDAPVIAPPQVDSNAVHVGPVLGRERFELLPRDVAGRSSASPRAPAARSSRRAAAAIGTRRADEGEVTRARRDETMHVAGRRGPLSGTRFRRDGRAGARRGVVARVRCSRLRGRLQHVRRVMLRACRRVSPADEARRTTRPPRGALVAAGARPMIEPGCDAARIHSTVAELLSRPGAREAARSLVPETGRARLPRS